ncbi:MAG TPA: hypothetical protein VHD36_14905 [Pirellulales bacterium]|nr:hypothetical protein [Pirellulales bacterium]
MRYSANACLLVLLVLLVDTAPAARASEASAEIVAPLSDRQTLVVAHVDLLAFDAAETIDWLGDLLELPEGERNRMQAETVLVNVLRQTLPEDASVDLYVVSSLADFGRMPFFLALPLEGATPATAIAAEARRDLEKAWGRPLQSERIGKALVTASPETIDRLKKNETPERPEIAAAFSAVGAGAVQVAFVPAAELRKLAETIAPQLPQVLGGGETKVFTRGIEWMAAGFELPPNDVTIRLVVQSPDAEAAAAVESALIKVFAAVGRVPAVQKAIPEYDELWKKLMPTASGDRLKLELTDANGGVAALTAFAAPVLRALTAGNTTK